MRNLRDLLFIYNIIDVTLLAVLFTNCVLKLRKDYFNLNPLMASSLLQYAYMATLTQLKIIITYPYSNVMIKDFEEGVHGEHSLSPTRVGFDSKLILNKNGRKLLAKYYSELKRYVTFIEF